VDTQLLEPIKTMTKLTDDLKRMLASLALQDAGEYLPLSQKIGHFGFQDQAQKSTPMTQPSHTKPATRRVGLIIGATGLGAPIDYALDICSKQGAKIDLLVHSYTDAVVLATLQNKIKSDGFDCHVIQLGSSPVEAICSYVNNHPSLIFLVSTSDNPSAKALIEDITPNQKSRIHAPVVLIENKTTVLHSEQSAA
jgi:hypothetical protein